MTLRRACTLLELVQVVNGAARNDEEVVATVTYLINSGRVRLCGTFAGAKIALRPALPLSLRDAYTHGMTPSGTEYGAAPSVVGTRRTTWKRHAFPARSLG